MHLKKSVRGIFQVIDQSRWLLMVIYSWLFSFTSLTNIIEATPCFRSPCNEQQCPQPSPAFLSHLVPSPACVGTAVAARRPFPPSSHSWAWECFNAPDVRGVARQSHEDWQRSVWGLHLPDVRGVTWQTRIIYIWASVDQSKCDRVWLRKLVVEGR